MRRPAHAERRIFHSSRGNLLRPGPIRKDRIGDPEQTERQPLQPERQAETTERGDWHNRRATREGQTRELFCEYKADATFLSRAFCGQNAYVSDQREEHTKSHSIRPATPQSEPSQRSNHSPGFGSGLYHRGATRTDRVGRHPAVPERNTPSRSSPSPIPCFAPQFRSPAPPPGPVRPQA